MIFSNRTPGVSVWSLGFCGGNQETVKFPVPCGLGAGRQCSPYMFLALGHLKKTNGMSHREPLCWRRGTVPVPYVDALAARRSTSHRLSLASKKKILRFLPPVSSLVFFPFSFECKDLQPHQTAAPPTLPCTPTRVCKRMLLFIWNVQFKRFC